MTIGLASLALVQGCGQSAGCPRHAAHAHGQPHCPPPYTVWAPLAPRWSERDLRAGEMYGPPGPPPPRVLTRRVERSDPPRIGAGSTSALVFQGFDAAGSHSHAELSRNDAALSPHADGPLLATTEWPERERASLAYPRHIYLNNRPDSLLFFENESKYRWGGASGGYRGAPTTSHHGVWGFWR